MSDLDSPPFAAVLVMAGRGVRFGGELPKVHQELSGRPAWTWSAATLHSLPGCVELVLVVGAGFEERVGTEARRRGLDARVVTGGARRQDSVRNGLGATSDAAELVAIHDAARPLLRACDAAAVLRAVGDGCAVLGTPARDTVKVVDADGRVVATPDRSTLWLAATPQVLRRETALALHADAERSGVDVTDDAALAEAAGLTVRMVAGDPWNVKLTTPEDLELVEVLLERRTEA